MGMQQTTRKTTYQKRRNGSAITNSDTLIGGLRNFRGKKDGRGVFQYGRNPRESNLDKNENRYDISPDEGAKRHQLITGESRRMVRRVRKGRTIPESEE